MAHEPMKATHKLKKTLRVSHDEVYRKGTPACMKRLGGNVAILDGCGQVRSNKDGALALFSKNIFFRPTLKEWFEPVKKVGKT